MLWWRNLGQVTDSQLLAKADRASLEEFYCRYSSMVYRYCRQMARDEDLAGEVTQLVFLAVIQQAQKFDVQRGSIAGWLFGIARNQLRKQWDWQRKNEAIDDYDPPAEPVCLDRAVSTSELREAVKQLPPLFREVVVLCELEELKYEEAASILEIPVGTVRSRLHRAKTQLAKSLMGKEFVRHEA
jgi:RNA polymerase sigma-70 factor, ECF subfamily